MRKIRQHNSRLIRLNWFFLLIERRKLWLSPWRYTREFSQLASARLGKVVLQARRWWTTTMMFHVSLTFSRRQAAMDVPSLTRIPVEISQRDLRESVLYLDIQMRMKLCDWLVWLWLSWIELRELPMVLARTDRVSLTRFLFCVWNLSGFSNEVNVYWPRKSCL